MRMQVLQYSHWEMLRYCVIIVGFFCCKYVTIVRGIFETTVDIRNMGCVGDLIYGNEDSEIVLCNIIDYG